MLLQFIQTILSVLDIRIMPCRKTVLPIFLDVSAGDTVIVAYWLGRALPFAFRYETWFTIVEESQQSKVINVTSKPKTYLFCFLMAFGKPRNDPSLLHSENGKRFRRKKENMHRKKKERRLTGNISEIPTGGLSLKYLPILDTLPQTLIKKYLPQMININD